MRNKIKQLLKKEGGFTLVELLGVIVILGLIIGISIPLIGNVVSGAKNDTDDAQQELVIDAAQMYFLQTKSEGDVTVGKLITDKYLEADYSGDKELTISKSEAEAGKLDE